MRIALTTSLVSSLHPAQANGPHAVVIDVARGLMTRGHQVRVYAAEGSSAPGIDIVGVPVDRAAAHAAVRMGRVPAADAVAALNRAFGGMFEMVRSHAPDVVSQHAFDAAAFQLVSGLPVLHTLHLPPMEGDIIGAVRGAEGHLATVSMAAQRAWEAAARREVAVLPNGVRPLEPVGGVTVPVALIAGRISPEKGTDTAIRVARRAGLAVLVVGEVYDSDYYTAVVEPLLCPGEWMGPVSREELFQLMARSAVLLMPVGWDEAFGLVAAEAQMAGCPVVAYRRGALPEVVPHGVGGVLVDPDDEDALVAAISLARGLDRRAIRGRARRELGVNPMINAYERDLMAVAADHSWARLAS